jgi:Amt family ammonium transporter
MHKLTGVLLGLLVLGTSLAEEAGAATGADAGAIDGATTAWLLVSTSFVFLMVIGLAFFYGGLVRRKNALNTMMMSFVALGVVSLTWTVIGYSLAYAEGSAYLGGLAYFGLRGVGLEIDGGIPLLLDFVFQGAFAIITAALISGAVVERMRFGAYMLFIALWSVAVYAPLAKWVWGGGFLASLGALDFAGGTVVHINAGVAALVLALLIGRRKDHGRKAMLPHQVPFTLLGAGLLWFGWFGFNGGSAYAADGLAALAVTNTLLAPAATIVIWAILDMVRLGKVTAVGVATGVIVGLVAITPGAGLVSPLSAILIGIIATFPSYYLLLWRARSSLDDSLDVFAAHGVGGVSGALLTGVFASTLWGSEVNGSLGQLMIQAVAVGIAIVFSAVMTFLIAKGVGLIVPLRVADKLEDFGMDTSMHGEEAYGDGEGALLIPEGQVTAGAYAPTPAGSKA